MTLQEKNRSVAEMLGLCWHELNHFPGDEANIRGIRCKKCSSIFSLSDYYDNHGNPNFIKDPVSLLREMMKREDWLWEGVPEKGGFSNEIGFWQFISPSIKDLKHFVRTDYITDQPGKLLEAAFEFLKGRGND